MSETVYKIFGEADERALAQLVRCAEAGDAPYAVLSADHHVGYSQPIGGAIAYADYISPTGVGYDIGCGNLAVRTNLFVDEVDVPAIMHEIQHRRDDGSVGGRISFGMGVPAKERVDHPVLDRIREFNFAPVRQMYDLAVNQLGTVGGGNHYVDLFADELGALWIGVHFGSRGFGHKTATGFFALADGGDWGDKAGDGEMDAPPRLFRIDSDVGQLYISAMRLAGDYARAGRDVVTAKVLEILGAEATYSVHNHHNYAWLEKHFGQELWVVRKGCTPAFPGQEGFVGATMGGTSVILRGVDSVDSREGLYNTVHGAGRVMSRTQAAGKVRIRTVYECTQRDCDYQVPARDYREGQTTCRDHGPHRFTRRRIEERKSEGRVDWPAVQARMAEQGIVLAGGGADEAPEVYKDLNEVLVAHAGTVEVLHALKPVGVAMAPRDVPDPYKD